MLNFVARGARGNPPSHQRRVAVRRRALNAISVDKTGCIFTAVMIILRIIIIIIIILEIFLFFQ